MVLINEEQKRAIEKTEGPLLIIAGPGTGKTRTLIERTRYILNQGLARPEEITLTTFTKKASQELVSRLSKEGEGWDGAKVHVENFHQLAGRVLETFASKIPYQPFYRIVSPEEIFRLTLRHWPILTGRGAFSPDFLKSEEGRKFSDLREDFLGLFPRANAPKKDQEGRNLRAYLRLMGRIREGFVFLDQGRASQGARRLLDRFQKMLIYYNVLDYSEMLYQALHVLQDEEALLTFQKTCRYLMVDEYQDTNPIQEKILVLLSRGTGNLCVVGDDDQSLYRFRGATVENLFTFKDRYPQAQLIRLKENYRSAPGILKAAQNFIESPYGDRRDQEVSRLRFKKDLTAQREKAPGQAFLYYEKNPQVWAQGIADLVEAFHSQGHPYSDLAILSHSVRDYNENITLLRRTMKVRGIPLRESGTGKLTRQEGVKRILAAVLLTLLGEEEKERASRNDPQVKALLAALPDRGKEERREIQKTWEAFFEEGKKTDLTTLALSFLKATPFREPAEAALQGIEAGKEKMEALAVFLRAEEDMAASDQREKIGKDSGKKWAKWLVEDWQALEETKLEISSDQEKEEDGVWIMTIHQSKGLEFPIVILEEESLKKTYYPPKEGADLLPPAPLLAHPPKKEWAERMDFLRKSYTAMTRAQDLLILTRTTVKNPWGEDRLLDPSFEKLNREIPPLDLKKALGLVPVGPIQKGRIKKTYAYTTDLALFEACPRVYFFCRVLGIPRPKKASAAFGSLIHAGLKNLHERKEKGEDLQAAKKDLGKDLLLAGEGLKKAGQALSPEALTRAEEILWAYQSRERDRILKEEVLAEKNIRLSMETYLLQGNLDLIMEGGRTILDFKSSLPPKGPLLDQYLGQLRVYRILVQESEKVEESQRKEGLYDLSALLKKDREPLFLWHFSDRDLQEFKERMDLTVQEIEKGAFQRKSAHKNDCIACPFRFFCGREKANPSAGRFGK